MRNVKQIVIKTISNEGLGSLSYFESRQEVPFKFKRMYYINNVPAGLSRGFHAHKDLWQLLFCPFGAINISVDDGSQKKTILLDNLGIGLIIGPGVWHTMEFKQSNSLLCVVASEFYSESDYIRSYDEFIQLMKDGYWK